MTPEDWTGLTDAQRAERLAGVVASLIPAEPGNKEMAGILREAVRIRVSIHALAGARAALASYRASLEAAPVLDAEAGEDGAAEYHGHATLEDGSHVALSPEQAKALWASMEAADAERASLMPTSEDAMRVILDARQRMEALGWRRGGGLHVRPGDDCAVREDGSTGIWSGWYDADGDYVHYCDGVSKPRTVWLKPISDLSDDERAQMSSCDASERRWAEGEFARWSSEDRLHKEPR